MSLDLFPDAPQLGAPMPTEMRRQAGISACGQYRWWMTRQWAPGPLITWIMLNPSTADHQKEDPTSRRVIDFSRRWGAGAAAFVNLYPFRSPDPAACRKWSNWQSNGPDWHARDRMIDNLHVVSEWAKKADKVMAAWGAGTWDDGWVEQVIEEVQQGDESCPDLYCLRKSPNGPTHPLARGLHRVPDDAQPVLWRPA